jgi:hypothetical protein
MDGFSYRIDFFFKNPLTVNGEQWFVVFFFAYDFDDFKLGL